MNVVRAGCRENTSGLRLRENYFSLDIPLYRTSESPTIRQPLQPPNASGTAAAQRNPKPSGSLAWLCGVWLSYRRQIS